MKRIASILLTLVLVVLLSACQKPNSSLPNDSKETTKDTEITEHTGKKISGDIKKMSTFSEGLGFVELKDENDIIYCVDKEGYIVFELKDEEVNISVSNLKFVNGIAQIDTSGSMCDKTGKITKPDDIGASYIYTTAVDGGYLIAVVSEDSYSGSVRKLGIMDMKYNWIVEPTENNYKKLTDKYGNLVLNSNTAPSISYDGIERDYYYNDYLYVDTIKKYLSLKTCELVDSVDFEFPSESWEKTAAGYGLKDTTLDLSSLENVSARTEFVNDKAVITFFNASAGKSYFTIIDTKGNFAFDPIEAFDKRENEITNAFFDGENVVLVSTRTNLRIKTYTVDGKPIADKTIETPHTVLACGYGSEVLTISTDGKYYGYDINIDEIF